MEVVSIGEGEPLRCAACGLPVTSTAARIDVLGRHEHVVANPAGVVFRIGCFAAAPGCQIASNPSSEWSWFPGHQWQLAVCAGCDAHLGWHYRRGGEPAFHGLILDRLRT